MPTHPAAQHPSDLPKFWIKPYYPSFNGIRGAAVFSVFLHHYAGFWDAEKLQSFTWAGVDLFFVLSGFLITGILYDSLHEDRYFRNFYVRRSLRIFPAYYALFLLLFLLMVPLHLYFPWTLTTFAVYLGNWFVPFVNLYSRNPTIIAISRHNTHMEVVNIGHFWSLCVEEQFYLIWPTVLWFVRDRKRLLWICCALCAVAPFERYLIARYIGLDSHFNLLHWSTYTRYDTILIGAILALWLRGRVLTTAQLRRLSLCLFWVPLVVLIVGLRLFCNSFGLMIIIDNSFLYTIGYTLIALSCAGILLLSLDETNLLSKAMRFRPLAALGTISYGFYLIHMLPESPLSVVSHHYPRVVPWVPVIAFAFTLAVATLSFRYLETPFLRLKRRFAPQQAPHSPDGALLPVRLHVDQPSA